MGIDEDMRRGFRAMVSGGLAGLGSEEIQRLKNACDAALADKDGVPPLENKAFWEEAPTMASEGVEVGMGAAEQVAPEGTWPARVLHATWKNAPRGFITPQYFSVLGMMTSDGPVKAFFSSHPGNQRHWNDTLDSVAPGLDDGVVFRPCDTMGRMCRAVVGRRDENAPWQVLRLLSRNGAPS